jgi:DNA-binding response OmpR family regulator/signal transduction histidine kinase
MSQRYRILAVDDEPDVLDVLRAALEEQYEVFTASSGEEALAILQRQPVDLLITDQRMPQMSGVSLLERAKDFCPDAVRIILTGYTEPADLIQAINRGEVYRYLTKPWDLEELLLTVRQGLENYQLRKDRDRLRAELQMRLHATSALLDIVRQAAQKRSYEGLIEAVVEKLPRLVDFDACLALIEEEGASGLLFVHCRRPLPQPLMLEVRARALENYRRICGRALPDKNLVVRFSGEPLGARDTGERVLSDVQLPLVLEGQPAGLLQLVSTRPEAFRQDTSELLDVLANQTSELIHGLRQTLSQERQRLELMVRSLPDGVIMIDERDQVFVINPAARALLHLPEQGPVSTAYLRDQLGFYPFDLIRGWPGEQQVVKEEIKLFDRVAHSIVSRVVQEGRTIGVAVVLRDLTEEKRLEERKEEFVSVVSHELRTPLTSIGGALDLLLNGFAGPISAKQERYLHLAKAGCEKLNNIVDELLDLRRLEEGRMKMEMAPLDISALVSEAAEHYQPAAQERAVELEVVTPGEVRVWGDRYRLHQVMSNLLSNALKFTAQGNRIRVEVLSRPDAVPGWVGVCVYNDGEEIAPEDHERIFDKFEQARRSRTGPVSGSGLGLSICRKIVEAHGGRIWVESGRGEGTRFIFTLTECPAGAPARAEAEAPPSRPRFKRAPRILMVEDELATALVLKGYLHLMGYQVQVCHRGQPVMQLVRDWQPELVIMDLLLPDFSGLELIDVLRHDPASRRIPVLAVSAAPREKEALEAGAAMFLLKPLDLQRLADAIDRLLVEKSGLGRRFSVLVVDDDPAIRTLSREVLDSQGFVVLEAENGAQALQIIRSQQVDAVLLDLMLPDFDGFQITEQIRADQETSDLPIIFISARGQITDKVRALKTGADDYLVKPFDALELGARVESVIKRKEREMDASPTTRLPGSLALEKEVERRLAAGQNFALCYVDLDNLKAFNDYYGYARADGIIKQTAALLRRAVEKYGGREEFVAHIAGDDFIFISRPDRLESIAREIIENFDRLIPLYYDPADQARGYIEAQDRYGTRRKFGFMTISLAALQVEAGRFRSHAEISERAAEIKRRAKAIDRSVLVIDGDPPRVIP